MASKEIKLEVTDATPDQKIGNQWMNGSTLVTLTPDDTKSTGDKKSIGMWRSEPNGSEINSSGGSKEHARYEWDKQDTLDLMVVGFTEGGKKIPPQTVLTLKKFDKLVGQSGTGLFFFRRTSYAVTWEIVGEPPKEEESPGKTLVVGRGTTKASTSSKVPNVGIPETMGPRDWKPTYPTLLQNALKKYPDLRGQFADIFIERIGINPNADAASEDTATGLTPGGVKAARDLLRPGGTLRILQNPGGGETFDSLEKKIRGLISTDFTITKEPERVPDGLLVTATKK